MKSKYIKSAFLTLRLFFLTVPLSLIFNHLSLAQQSGFDNDSSGVFDNHEVDEVVVSATRTSRLAKDVPMPISIIRSEEIERMGSMRLNEVLAEQTGLQVIQDHGSGLQMQGLSTDYILILIDGEPLVGRTKGNMDLTRLVVGNIDRIEIVKGPSSSLFGSEAMGGVVNIITKKGSENLKSSLRARYRKYNTIDISAEAGKQHNKAGWYVFANRLSSDGYFSKGATSKITKTVAPFTGYTFSGKFSYAFNEKAEVVINARFYNEVQKNKKLVNVNSIDRLVDEKTFRRDLSLTPTFTYTFSPGRKLQVRNHITTFNTGTIYHYSEDGSVYDDSYFNQLFNRTELQYDHEFNRRHISTIGAGNVIEMVDATRYESRNAFNQLYVFGQHQWQPVNTVNLVAGFRYDKHNQYADSLVPNWL